MEEINGIDYKKWYGQKLCFENATEPEPYESFTILESVGQIDNGYLFWNTDNCSIGGGFNYFTCYKNGDFNYPPGEECIELFLTDTEDILTGNILELFPNPVGALLNIESLNSKIEEVSIVNLEGKELINKKVNGNSFQLNLSELNVGIYFIKIKSDDQIMVNKIVKQ